MQWRRLSGDGAARSGVPGSVALLALLVLLVALAAAGSPSPAVDPSAAAAAPLEDLLPEAVEPLPEQDPRSAVVEEPPPLDVPLGPLVLLLALALAGLAARGLLRLRSDTAPPRSPVPAAVPQGEPGGTATALRHAADDLWAAPAGGEADAVVACWQRLEAEAASWTAPRRGSETASEWSRRCARELQRRSGATGVDLPPLDTALTDLRALYLRARFSADRSGVGPEEVAAAAAALEQVLAGVRAGGPAGAGVPRAAP